MALPASRLAPRVKETAPVRFSRRSVIVGLVATALTAPAALIAQAGVDTRPPNGADQKPAFAGQTDAPERKSNVAFDVVTVAGTFENPWGLAFLPNGKMLVTERPGRLRVVSADGKLSEPVAGLPPVDARGQGGLLDVAIDPAFASNDLIYWTYAERRTGNTNNTAAARGRLADEGGSPSVDHVEVIYHQYPSLSSTQH